MRQKQNVTVRSLQGKLLKNCETNQANAQRDSTLTKDQIDLIQWQIHEIGSNYMQHVSDDWNQVQIKIP